MRGQKEGFQATKLRNKTSHSFCSPIPPKTYFPSFYPQILRSSFVYKEAAKVGRMKSCYAEKSDIVRLIFSLSVVFAMIFGGW